MTIPEKRTYLGTTFVWFILCIGHAFWLRHEELTTLRDDTLYAKTLSFEAIAFVTFFFPLWLLLLGLVTGAEALYFSWRRRRNMEADDTISF